MLHSRAGAIPGVAVPEVCQRRPGLGPRVVVQWGPPGGDCESSGMYGGQEQQIGVGQPGGHGL